MAQLIEHRILKNLDKPERVIVCLHGIGQNSAYMEEAGRIFSEKMPNTLIVMPEAPLKMEYSAEKTEKIREKYDPGFDPDKARSWFKTGMSTAPWMMLKLAFNRVAPVNQVSALASYYRDKYGLQDKDIAFFGMSQGGAIALYSAVSREKPCAAVVSHSGMYFGFARAKSKPDVLMITGEHDDFLCDNKSRFKSFFVAPENSLRRLKRAGLNVKEIWYPHLGHEMSTKSINTAAEYLRSAFGLPANTNTVAAPKPAPVPLQLAQ